MFEEARILIKNHNWHKRNESFLDLIHFCLRRSFGRKLECKFFYMIDEQCNRSLYSDVYIGNQSYIYRHNAEEFSGLNLGEFHTHPWWIYKNFNERIESTTNYTDLFGAMKKEIQEMIVGIEKNILARINILMIPDNFWKENEDNLAKSNMLIYLVSLQLNDQVSFKRTIIQKWSNPQNFKNFLNSFYTKQLLMIKDLFQKNILQLISFKNEKINIPQISSIIDNIIKEKYTSNNC